MDKAFFIFVLLEFQIPTLVDLSRYIYLYVYTYINDPHCHIIVNGNDECVGEIKIEIELSLLTSQLT